MEPVGQVAGVGKDASILVVPTKCIPPGVGRVQVYSSPAVTPAQKKAIRRQRFFLNLWSQCRVAAVVGLSFGLPLMLTDYSGAPPLAYQTAAVSQRPIISSAHSNSAARAEFNPSGFKQDRPGDEPQDSGWLGWSIWGSCSRPQSAFDPGSNDTIEAFGKFSRTYKLEQDKKLLANCITGAFGARCDADTGYAAATAHRAESATYGVMTGVTEG